MSIQSASAAKADTFAVIVTQCDSCPLCQADALYINWTQQTAGFCKGCFVMCKAVQGISLIQ